MGLHAQAYCQEVKCSSAVMDKSPRDSNEHQLLTKGTKNENSLYLIPYIYMTNTYFTYDLALEFKQLSL